MSGVSMDVRDQGDRSRPCGSYHPLTCMKSRWRQVSTVSFARGLAYDAEERNRAPPTCGYVDNCQPRSYPHTHRLNKKKKIQNSQTTKAGDNYLK